VGLPNETLQIKHGDLYVKGQGDSDFHIIRKPPEKLKAIAQIVHDNDYVSQALIDKNWPTRWQEWGANESGYWQVSDDTRTYSIDGKQPGDAWIRYEHTVPSEAVWFQQPGTRAVEPRPQLITDFYAFNTEIQRRERGADTPALGLHWVGDLMLECQVDVKSDQGEILLDLVKGGRHVSCHIDVATGKATLSIDGLPAWQPAAETPVRGGGSYALGFANIDRQLTLWVNGTPIAFDQETTYDDLNNDRPQSTPDDPGDLAPVGIGSRGAALDVTHLRVLRDIYYIADSSNDGLAISDYPTFSPVYRMNRRQFADFLATPSEWNSVRGSDLFASRKTETFPLGPDQFFVLGDNSPESSDARFWTQQYVDRELLVGKAFLIYWPHALRLPIPGTDAALGIIPNVSEMGLIR
jgi:signal peptidase I